MILLNKALKKKIILFIYLWPCWVLGDAGASLVAEQGSTALRLNSCGSQAPGHRLLWRVGSAAQRHVGCFLIRDWTQVSGIGRWILYQCATREALKHFSWCLTLNGLGPACRNTTNVNPQLLTMSHFRGQWLKTTLTGIKGTTVPFSPINIIKHIKWLFFVGSNT